MTETPGPRRTRLPASPFISPARPLAALAQEQLAAIFGKRGFANADILANWRAIAGDHLARSSQPEKLVWPPRRPLEEEEDARTPTQGAVLHLRVEGPAAIEIQHMAPQIIERINQFFGFAAVARLRILQAPLRSGPARAGGAAQPEPARAGEKQADGERTAEARAMKGIADPQLASALARLGAARKSR